MEPSDPDDGADHQPPERPSPPPGFGGAGAVGSPSGIGDRTGSAPPTAASAPRPSPERAPRRAKRPKRWPWVVLLVLVIAAVVGFVSLSDGGDASRGSGSEQTEPTDTAETTEPTVAPSAEPQGTGSVGRANAVGCEAERRVVETAVAAFEVTEGAPPADAQALVGSYLDELPQHAEVRPDGTVVMTGDCA